MKDQKVDLYTAYVRWVEKTFEESSVWFKVSILLAMIATAAVVSLIVNDGVLK